MHKKSFLPFQPIDAFKTRINNKWLDANMCICNKITFHFLYAQSFHFQIMPKSGPNILLIKFKMDVFRFSFLNKKKKSLPKFPTKLIAKSMRKRT